MINHNTTIRMNNKTLGISIKSRNIQYIYDIRIFISNGNCIVFKSLINSMRLRCGKNKQLGFSGNCCIRYHIISLPDILFNIFLSLEIPRQDLLTRKNFLIILQVSLQQLRRIQTIRALAHAVAAVEAVLDLHHLRLYLRCELEVGRGSSEKQGHSRAGVDLDPCRTWHTVAAGTAEASE